MKKLLSAILSISLLFASTNSYCFAKTAWNSYSREGSAKPISVFKQKNGEKVIVQGEESPTIVINNKSESKASASASGGSSTISKLFLLAIKLGVGVLAAKFAISKLISFGGYVSDGVSKGFADLKNLATNITANITASMSDKDEENKPAPDNKPKNGSNFISAVIEITKNVGISAAAKFICDSLLGYGTSY